MNEHNSSPFQHNLPEAAINLLASDNLEVACSVVERVAMDKAVLEVDDGLASAYESRRKSRQRGSTAFCDSAATVAAQYTQSLPDPLSLKPNGLQPPQLRVYEDFGRIRSALNGHDDSAGPRAESPLEQQLISGNLPPGQHLNSPSTVSVQQAVERFGVSKRSLHLTQ